MKKLLLCLLLCAPLTFAIAPKEFNWIPPTQYVDGTALPDAEIESYNIYCNSVLLGNVPNTGGTDSWTSDPLPDGTYSCFATTIASNGEESDPSNAANFTVLPSKPEAPTNFSVTLP
jgi:hypothetical protein